MLVYDLPYDGVHPEPVNCLHNLGRKNGRVVGRRGGQDMRVYFLGKRLEEERTTLVCVSCLGGCDEHRHRAVAKAWKRATNPTPVIRTFLPSLLQVLDQMVCRVEDIPMDGGHEHRGLIQPGGVTVSEHNVLDDRSFAGTAGTYWALG